MNARGERGKTIALCLLAALFEGLDIQSMGVAAPQVAPALGLDPQRMGLVLSASIVGLMIGAAWGGRASDRHGRRAVLMVSLSMFGLFSLLTTQASGFVSLVAIRLLTGLGLGGTLPNLIALTSDVAPQRHRVALLGLIYAGLPLGGIAAGAVAAIGGADSWKLVFVAGGLGPLILVPLLYLMLPVGRTSIGGANTDLSPDGLFGPNARRTLLLWVAYFFTLLAVYLLLNWLPTLMAGKGAVGGARATIWLNLGAVIGSLLLGRWADRRSTRTVLLVSYAGMLASMLLLVVVPDRWALAACFAAGFFVIGGQLILYAMAPTVYPAALRGTGIGAAVAAGRAGSVIGPLLAGLALGAGLRTAAVPAIALPGLIVAWGAALVLAGKIRAGDAPD